MRIVRAFPTLEPCFLDSCAADTFYHTNHLALPSLRRCNQYCSNNVVTTVTDAYFGLYSDIFTVIRLIGVCFGNHGLGGCMCKFISSLEPEWRRVSTSKKVRCEDGDPFQLIVAQLNSQIIDWSQWATNELIKGVNNFLTGAFCWLGVCPPGPFNLACFGDPRRPRKCEGFPGDLEAARIHFEECENEALKGGLDLTCYYHRVRACTHTLNPPCYTIPHTHTLQLAI